MDCSVCIVSHIWLWWMQLCIAQLQRTICGQKCGSKLHFVLNHNKVQLCSKMFHFAHQFSQISRADPSRTHLLLHSVQSAVHGSISAPVHPQPSLTSTFKYLPRSVFAIRVNFSHFVSFSSKKKYFGAYLLGVILQDLKWYRWITGIISY